MKRSFVQLIGIWFVGECHYKRASVGLHMEVLISVQKEFSVSC